MKRCKSPYGIDAPRMSYVEGLRYTNSTKPEGFVARRMLKEKDYKNILRVIRAADEFQEDMSVESEEKLVKALNRLEGIK